MKKKNLSKEEFYDYFLLNKRPTFELILNYSADFRYFELTCEDFIHSLTICLNSSSPEEELQNWIRNIYFFMKKNQICFFDSLISNCHSLRSFLDKMLPIYEQGFLTLIFSDLYYNLSDPELVDFIHLIINNLESFISQRENQILDKKYSDKVRIEMINLVRKNDALEFLTTFEKQLFKEFVEVLNDENIEEAVFTKAYYSWHINSVFDYDLDTALNLFHVLADECDNQEAIMELAKLYDESYESEDKWDIAFKYYTSAAFSDNQLALYELCKAYAFGVDVPRNIHAASNIACKLYDSEKKSFALGMFRNYFVEAALAMAITSDCQDEPDDMVTYSYILEAEYALSKRSQISPNDDDSVLLDEILEMKNDIGSRIHLTNNNFFHSPIFPYRLLSSSDILITVKELKNYTKLTFESSRKDFDGKLLLTVEDCDYCELVDKVEIKVTGFDEMSEFIHAPKKMLVNHLDYFSESNIVSLINDNDEEYSYSFINYEVVLNKKYSNEYHTYIKVDGLNDQVYYIECDSTSVLNNRGGDIYFITDGIQKKGKVLGYVYLNQNDFKEIEDSIAYLSSSETKIFA